MRSNATCRSMQACRVSFLSVWSLLRLFILVTYIHGRCFMPRSTRRTELSLNFALHVAGLVMALDVPCIRRESVCGHTPSYAHRWSR